jgi:hypothetical protein
MLAFPRIFRLPSIKSFVPASKSDRLLVVLCDFTRKILPTCNDTYYVSFPLRIAEIPALNLTE